jgi:NAD(P)H-dependent FMN reductase
MSLAPQGVDMRVSSSVATLPLFSPDLELSCSASVDVWVQEMRRADGLVISTPEYAGGYPGALKNALDWLVATDAFVNKPFMLLNASARSLNAQRTLVKVLETMSGVHVETASTTIPLLGTKLDASGILANPGFSGKVRDAIGRFVAVMASLQHEKDKILQQRTGRGYPLA